MPAIALSDRFDSIDGAKWAFSVTSGASVTADGQLHSDPGDGTIARDARIDSVATFDFTEKHATIELVQALPAVAGAQVIFALRDPVANADVRFLIRSETDGGQINVRRTGGGFTAQFSAYNPVQHRFLRFAMEGGTLRWQVSPTGEEGSFTTLSSATDASLTADLTNAKLWIGTGVFAATSGDPGAATFDNLNAPVVQAGGLASVRRRRTLAAILGTT